MGYNDYRFFIFFYDKVILLSIYENRSVLFVFEEQIDHIYDTNMLTGKLHIIDGGKLLA